jgi:hypothetical protein
VSLVATLFILVTAVLLAYYVVAPSIVKSTMQGIQLLTPLVLVNQSKLEFNSVTITHPGDFSFDLKASGLLTPCYFYVP